MTGSPPPRSSGLRAVFCTRFDCEHSGPEVPEDLTRWAMFPGSNVKWCCCQAYVVILDRRGSAGNPCGSWLPRL